MQPAPTITLVFAEPPSGSADFRWLSPVLVGLSVPLAFGLLLFPVSITSARAPIVALLLAALLVCVAAYALSILRPGAVTMVAADEACQQVRLTIDGAVSSTERTIPFSAIASTRLLKHYDDDGYPVEIAELRLTDGEAIVLPSTMTAADVAAFRQAIGHGEGRVPRH